MKYKQHREKWNDCEKCELCNQRGSVVLARGKIPCDLLFIGEAPGQSEDVLGVPFAGPAGKLLDSIIEKAYSHVIGADIVELMPMSEVSIAFTNIVSCIPKGEDGNKIKEPEKQHILACADRLREFVMLAKPKVIVCVGLLAEKWLPQLVVGKKLVNIIHPAAILRMDVSQKGLARQRCVVRIADAIEEL